MKPLHVLAAAAILVVAALVAFLAMHDDGRAGGYRSGTQASGTGSRAPRADAPSADTAAADAAGAATGSQEPGAASDDAGPISITLRIVGPDDAPASGADVTLDRSVDALRAKADEMGVLLVHDLKPGVYDLRARHGQLGGALRFETKGALDLGTLRLTAAVTITGHVYGPESEPVPNALVEARRAIVREGAAPRVPLPEGATADATTDAKGAYALVVPTGEAYALRATARGLAPANREPALFATDTSGIDLYLREGAVLAGRVVADGDRPVPGARILVADPRGADDRPATGEAATGPDGAFSLLAEPGAHMLVVIAAGCARERGIFTAPRTDIVVTLRAGASLRLLAVEAGRARAPAARVRATVTHIGGSSDGETDGNGRLLIENLPIDSRAVTGQRLRLSGAGFLPLVIDLARAQPVDGVVDLGVVELARGGVVTGRVLDRTTGEPVGGARVGAFGGRPGQITAERMASGVSAQDGSFRLEGVPLDAHTLTATHAHFVDESVPTLIGGGSGGPMLFRQGSREAVRDVELVPAERIAGAVLGPDDAPVTEAEVSVVADERGRIARLLGGDAATARSDGKGAFVLEGFHLGQRTKLVARHADYGPSEEVDAVVGEPATLRLAEPTTLAGLVTDPSGIAIEDVRVEAAGRTGTTDGAGRFLVRNVAIGRLRVKFEHPDYLPAEYEVKFTGSMDLGRTALVPGGSIVGVVVRDDQTPAPGVTVHATREPAGGTPGRTSGSAVTDAKGTFEIRGLGEGDYRLRVRTGKAWSADAAARTGARDVRIVLVPAGKLLGRVVARGVAVAGARVHAEQGGATLGWARSAEDGTFEISAVPPESPFEVVIEHDAFRRLRVEDALASDRPRTFALEPGAEVAGFVVDGRGSVVAGAEVAVRVDGRDARRVVTDAQGGFEARGLDEGIITVALDGADGAIVPTGWIEAAPGARGVRLVAAEGMSISGLVRYSEGRPARSVSVTAIDAEGRRAGSTWAFCDDGSFELRGLRPGRYTVRAEQVLGLKRAGEINGVDAGARNVEIRLTP